jgi:hypothetical protein
MNLDEFEVHEAIVHDLPHGGSDEDPRLTDAPIDLDDRLSGYFRTKIIKSLSLRGVAVVGDPDGDSAVRDAVATILGDPDALVAASQEIAGHLHEVQTGRNSAGLLTVVIGALDDVPCVCVLKLEREQGLRFNITTDDEGRNTVDLELLRELTLTEKTKVFKTAVFVCPEGGDGAAVEGRVADDQRGRQDGPGVAGFYLGEFLGCQLKENPAERTLAFAQAADRFFAERVADPHTQGSYQLAMLTELQSNALDLRPQSFARDHLKQPDRAPFMDAMRGARIDPTVAFAKDVELVRIDKLRIDFERHHARRLSWRDGSARGYPWGR